MGTHPRMPPSRHVWGQMQVTHFHARVKQATSGVSRNFVVQGRELLSTWPGLGRLFWRCVHSNMNFGSSCCCLGADVVGHSRHFCHLTCWVTHLILASMSGGQELTRQHLVVSRHNMKKKVSTFVGKLLLLRPLHSLTHTNDMCSVDRGLSRQV